MSTADTLLTNIEDHIYNPAGIQRTALAMLSEVSNGEINIMDANSPFTFLLETSSVLTSAAISKSSDLTRRHYAVSTINQDDLYLHMSDKDFIDRFATPSSTKFAIIMSKDELDKLLIEDTTTGIRKIIIPRNTVFNIADTDFSIQYPIEIRKLIHGGYQIVYDGEITSPLQALSTNNIDFVIRKTIDGEFIYFEVDAKQFNIISKISSLNAATGFKIDIPIDDYFYYCRVYHENTNGKWVELTTTHTPDIFDIKNPTAVIKVIDKVVTVEIPQIFTTNKVLTRNIRIDVYQTKGPLNMILANYDVSNYSAKWLALDVNERNEYVAPLSAFSNLMLLSTYTVTGGSNPVDFDTLRNRVITNSVGINKIPITPDQLNTTIERNGYEIVKNVDLVTNRILLATKDIPIPTNKISKSAASVTIGTIETTMETSALLSGVKDNGLRQTITSDAIYGFRNGLLTHITKEEINSINSLPVDQKATTITDGNYLYSPFHYVLDATGNIFDLRPYYLDNPVIQTKLFVNENDTTQLQVSAASFSIVKTDIGYSIYVLTKSDDAYKALADNSLIVQLAYYPPGEKDRAYLNGSLLTTNTDKERVFEFKLNSNFDIDNNNYLYLTNFLMYTEDQITLPSELITEFDLFFGTTTVANPLYSAGLIEASMGYLILPSAAKGIMHEKLKIKFGDALTTLWARSRTVVSPYTYRKYQTNIPLLYTDNIFKPDPITGANFTIDVNGDITYDILHKKNDPVLDIDGNPVYKHLAGDVMLDDDGNPILENPRKLARICDLLLVDGVYWFTNSTLSNEYKKEITAALVKWLVDDLEGIEDILLEKTDIYFYPKVTTGNIDVLINAGIKSSLFAQQSFSVTLYVPDRVYSNDDLKEVLKSNTIDILMSELTNQQISISKIIETLRISYGTDVIDVKLNGFGNDSTINVATIINNSNRFSIKKKLVALADNTLSITDDVSFEFVRHRL